MQCDRCGSHVIERKASDAAPYDYRESGLKNVFLCGIVVRTCPRCESNLRSSLGSVSFIG